MAYALHNTPETNTHNGVAVIFYLLLCAIMLAFGLYEIHVLNRDINTHLESNSHALVHRADDGHMQVISVGP